MCHIVFFFLKIVIHCQISTIQSQLPKSAVACFNSSKIKAQEVTELSENAATFSNKFQLQQSVNMILQDPVPWKTIRFVCFRSSNTPLFFSGVDLLVCFGLLSRWKPRCVRNKLHILCQKVIQILWQPPEHPTNRRFEGHRDVVWQKRTDCFIKIYTDCFVQH